jgi:hypothetical protein
MYERNWLNTAAWMSGMWTTPLSVSTVPGDWNIAANT